MQTTNVVDENIKRIGELFPNCLTERLGDDGKPETAIDFDQLRQELSKEIVEGPDERYQFTWPDKRNAIRLANAPTTDTLRPCRNESVDFDNTQNLYIEGDNLQVLKLLRENYLGKVKMIYIDPPYNTGNDFVYNDDFAQEAGEYIHNSGQYDQEGNRLVANTESNGRFHTDWLNMIYPRLKVAKDLLSEDGVIFISIDDCELKNLENICNEIFGEINKIANITREAIKGGSKSKNIREVNDYLLCYARNVESIEFGGIEVEGLELNLEDEYGKYAKGRELNKWGAGSRREDSPSMFYPIPGPNGEQVYPIRNDGSEGRWRLGKEKMSSLLNAHNAIFERRDNGTYIVYEKIRNDSPKIKQFTTLFKDEYINAKGTEEIKTLFNLERAIFDFSKPTLLVKDLILLADAKESIILDFFSGSATTAHAVMQLNAEDGGHRKFIMVQLPEETDEKSEARKAGYKNICEIGKERIRRAGKKIKEEHPEAKDLDIGFRVLKLDSSNMKDVFYTPSKVTQTNLFDSAENIKEDRLENDGEDLLFQVMIELGISLSAKIKKETIAGKAVWNVNDGYLLACFAKDLDESVITDIAKQKPYYFVMRDAGLANDNVADNFDQLFKYYSPETIRRII